MRRAAWTLNGLAVVLLPLWVLVSPIYALPFWATILAMTWCDWHLEPRRRLPWSRRRRSHA